MMFQLTGTVIEAHLDKKRGATGTLLVKDGTLKSGQFVVAGNHYAPTRIMEDYAGNSVCSAEAAMPVCVVGWSKVPTVGTAFSTVGNNCLLYTSPSPRDRTRSRMPSSA